MGHTAENDVLEDRIGQIRRRDRRFGRHAYFFVLDSLDYTMATLGRDQRTGEERHVGGQELLQGLRDLAAEQFGPMAPTVFLRWGVNGTGDFGEIVFNLIDAGLLSRRPQDSRLDFAGAYDFESEFRVKFQERLDAISRTTS